MKTLAISLLRLGDLFCHAHVLKALSEQRNESITLLTHPFYQQVEFLFPFVEEAVLFKREQCQYSIGENYYNKIWPFEHIASLLNDLNKESFTTIADLTQTETSARWLTYLRGQNKIGVQYDVSLRKKEFCSDNIFIKYLHSNKSSERNFIDIFKRSLGLHLTALPQSENSREQLVVFQTLTSDPKKNWPLESWRKVIVETANQLSEFRLIILSSPSEEKILKAAFQGLPLNCEIATTDLRETYNLLKSASLLVSGDTAIKHLGTITKTPIIEIAVGSSNPRETGAYQEGAWIIEGSSPCSPCRHSSQCSQPGFLCHSTISPELVTNAIINRLSSNNSHALKRDQNLFLEKIKTVHQNHEGWWTLKPLIEKSEERYAGRRKEPDQIIS
ncbi:MAG: hypothetical protein RJB66_2036 [Pseudomonadota bacterium]|jgi:ADP-heptose:LPS heptosyltransferase